MSSVPGSMQANCVCSAQFIPSPPEDAYFDSARQAWVFSRYEEVQAALRARALHQASSRGETFPATEDEALRAGMFGEVKGEIADIQAGRWRADMEYEARCILGGVDGETAVDLLGDIALPWSLAILRKMSGAAGSRRIEIAGMAASILYKKAFALDLEEAAKPHWLRSVGIQWTKTENPEGAFDALIARGELAISKMMFLAVTQSLPAFLAKAWLALMLHPDQMEVLRADPSRLPLATTELLRYAGIVHTLHRKAAQDLQIGSAQIKAADRVELRVACANFDPERFRDPNQLDIARPVQSHVSLGAGLHACAGAVLVRHAFAATTPAFLAAGPSLIGNRPVVWMGDSTLRWPLAVWVK